MSDQPKPTTGAWTARTAIDIAGDNFNGAWDVANAHNASLAAAQQQLDTCFKHELELETKLAAEREKREKAESANRQGWKRAEQLREQLAAAVQALKEIVVVGQEESGGIQTKSERIADAALAKIGGKP